MLYRRPDGTLARLRRQDTVTRLSCTRPIPEVPGIATVPGTSDSPETIVLDLQASRQLLELLGFEAVDRVRFIRETWRSCQYFLHLDRVEGLGDYLTIQAEQGTYRPKVFRRLALKFLKSMGIAPAWNHVDKMPALPYTARESI